MNIYYFHLEWHIFTMSIYEYIDSKDMRINQITSEGRSENSCTLSADTMFISISVTLHTTVFNENVICNIYNIRHDIRKKMKIRHE
jgi:hypothetical protein